MTKSKTPGDVKLASEAVITVLGASGDLAHKKTFPALFNLFRMGLLPKNTSIIGYARSKMSDKDLHERVVSHLSDIDSPEGKETVGKFLDIVSYHAGSYDDPAAFAELEGLIEKVEEKRGVAKKGSHRLFYMALPPSVFIKVAKHLKESCYSPTGSNRIIIEKPFGKDLESCKDMLKQLAPLWSEDETFRMSRPCCA